MLITDGRIILQVAYREAHETIVVGNGGRFGFRYRGGAGSGEEKDSQRRQKAQDSRGLHRAYWMREKLKR
jgi:hypothetical protein